jgi:hypothetical protein
VVNLVMSYTLIMPAELQPKIAADGVQEVPLTIARRLLTTLIEQAREKQLVSAFTVRKRRRAYLVSADFYDRALAALGEPPAPASGQQPA